MAGRFCTERQLCFVFYTDNEAAIVTIQQPLSREVFLAYLCQNPETYKQKCHHRR